jgi:hypothetical protein
LPAPLLDQLRGQIERAANEQAARFPLNVRQVAFRPGCVAIMGTTP